MTDHDEENPLKNRVQMLMSDAMIAAIDEWRRRQPDMPNRSEAIRRLVQRGMDR